MKKLVIGCLVALVGAAAWQATAQTPRPPLGFAEPLAPPEWEYLVQSKVELLQHGKGDVRAGLNQLGADGWELAAVESPALVDVVRGNAESIHRLHLILDQRCQHLFGLLPCATLLPLGEFHAFAPGEIGGENSPELVYQRRIMKTYVGFFA